MTGLKLHTNGILEVMELPEAEQNFIRLQKAINCDWIDIVHAVNLPEPYCLVVDDEALLKDDVKLNVIGSYLYGVLEHGQPICGDCLIMKDHETPNGIETVGLEREDFVALSELLFNSTAGVNLLISKLHKRGAGDENK